MYDLNIQPRAPKARALPDCANARLLLRILWRPEQRRTPIYIKLLPDIRRRPHIPQTIPLFTVSFEWIFPATSYSFYRE